MARKKTTRWYEKNEYLSAFMNLMKDLPIDEQCEIAVDMILKTSCLIDRQYENFIKDIAFFNPRDFKRWYDKNPNIHLAIEALRDLTSVQQEEVVQEFCDKILKRHDSEKKVENK